ncbi:MAG: hypothetical protein GWN67_28845 [Phycisphaerae bacterium]|nr:hypothetical protein [Phycisphaerae bacterium]NIW11936.1 hypothetical protein [Gammaproteobacteria bacterium]NIW96535.1 hypothetical protein [Phycisphaerae bacterium]
MEKTENGKLGNKLLVAGYWFSGGYIFAWWTPYATEAGLIGAIMGLVLLAWTHFIEDRGGNVPPLLGCALFAPPLTLMLIGGIGWIMERLRLL